MKEAQTERSSNPNPLTIASFKERPLMAENLQRELIGVPKDRYGASHADHLLNQYKLYVEMADKVSERRQSANSFFLTINTALVAALGVAWPRPGGFVAVGWYAIVGLAGMILCYSWYRLLRSYRDLNTAKFKVVRATEQHLPLRLYDAEWASAGRGEDPKLYLPFTHIETRVPWVFFALYLALIVLAVFAHMRGKG